MTTPQPPPQAPAAAQAQQDAALAVAIATALAMTAAVTVGGVLSLVVATTAWKQARMDARALRGALGVIMSMPPELAGISGPASATVARLNLLRRAQFAVASTRRIMAQLAQARSTGVPFTRALADAVSTERRYFGQHMEAIWQRQKAASQADSAALSYGRLLGWHTVLDRHTSAECRAANGRNFYVEQMPLIGYPGGVHPHCRCYPGRPWPGGRMLPSGR